MKMLVATSSVEPTPFGDPLKGLARLPATNQNVSKRNHCRSRRQLPLSAMAEEVQQVGDTR